MKLKDTVELMLSDNYKDRLKSEYFQIRLRYNALIRFLYHPNKNKELTEEQKELMKKQSHYMYHYMIVLSERCKAEGVNLNE